MRKCKFYIVNDAVVHKRDNIIQLNTPNFDMFGCIYL